MEGTDNTLYLGIDISDEYSQISYWNSSMKEPESINVIAGTSKIQIPTVLYKSKENGVWFFGEEAKKMCKQQHGILIEQILSKCQKKERFQIEEQVYEAKQLLQLFVKRLLGFVSGLGIHYPQKKMVFVLEYSSKELVETLLYITEELGLQRENIKIIDYKEGYYFYTINQPEEYFSHEVALFDYKKEVLTYHRMRRNAKTVPQIIEIEESKHFPLSGIEEQYVTLNIDQQKEKKDEIFTFLFQEILSKKIVDTIYLIGTGFNGGWLAQSLKVICPRRRVFLGNNFYAKGACYAAKSLWEGQNRRFIYFGANKIKTNILIQARRGEVLEQIPLIEAGINWYENGSTCEVILGNDNKIEIWENSINGQVHFVDQFVLTGLPKRPDRATRLRIETEVVSVECAILKITDLGFGGLFEATMKQWEFEVLF